MSEQGERQPRKVKGFVVMSGDDSYLTDDRFWFPHDKPEEGYVFTEESVKNTIEASANQNWDMKPTAVVPAEFDGGKVKVTGHKISLSEFLSQTKQK